MQVFNMDKVNVLYCFDSKFWRMAAVSTSAQARKREVSCMSLFYASCRAFATFISCDKSEKKQYRQLSLLKSGFDLRIMRA